MIEYLIYFLVLTLIGFLQSLHRFVNALIVTLVFLLLIFSLGSGASIDYGIWRFFSYCFVCFIGNCTGLYLGKKFKERVR